VAEKIFVEVSGLSGFTRDNGTLFRLGTGQHQLLPGGLYVFIWSHFGLPQLIDGENAGEIRFLWGSIFYFFIPVSSFFWLKEFNLIFPDFASFGDLLFWPFMGKSCEPVHLARARLATTSLVPTIYLNKFS
jgi:hypothetical protein